MSLKNYLIIFWNIFILFFGWLERKRRGVRHGENKKEIDGNEGGLQCDEDSKFDKEG